MTEHITPWLAAYHDGELSSKRKMLVQVHLSECASCQNELQKISSLAGWLNEFSLAQMPTPPDRFVAQVNLRLPREQVQPAWKRTLEAAWKLIPFALLGFWVFIQAVLIVSGILMLALQIGIGADLLFEYFPVSAGSLGFFSGLELTGASFSDIRGNVVSMVSRGGPLGWGVTGYLLLTALIGLMYWGWLASWRMRRKRDVPHGNRIKML